MIVIVKDAKVDFALSFPRDCVLILKTIHGKNANGLLKTGRWRLKPWRGICYFCLNQINPAKAKGNE
jgi:hypothetical protein